MTAESKVTTSYAHALFARWEANKYKVSFDPNGGEMEDTEIEVTYDDYYNTLPTPTLKYHVFTGWYTEKEGGDLVTNYTVVKISDEQQLYAHWGTDVIPLDDCEVTVEYETTVYDGTEKKPAVTVALESKELVKEKDYTVYYSSNKDVGTASVIVYGKEMYSGSVERSFEITEKSIRSDDITVAVQYVYMNGDTTELTATVKDGKKTLSLDYDYTTEVTSVEDQGKGTYVIKYKIAGINNYNEESDELEYTYKDPSYYEPESDTESDNEPVSDNEPESDTAPATDNEPESDTAPTSDNEPESDIEPASDNETESDTAPTSDNEPETDTEPASDNEPESDTTPTSDNESESDTAPTSDNEPESDTMPHTDEDIITDTDTDTHIDTSSDTDSEKSSSDKDKNIDTDKQNEDQTDTDIQKTITVTYGMLGDLDEDESITAADALETLRISIGLSEADDAANALADVDGDGNVTANDALDILRFSIGLSSSEGIGKTLTKEVSTGTTIYVKLTGDQSYTPTLYYWGTEDACEWPGVPMKDTDGDGWYEYFVKCTDEFYWLIVDDKGNKSADFSSKGDTWAVVTKISKVTVYDSEP